MKKKKRKRKENEKNKERKKNEKAEVLGDSCIICVHVPHIFRPHMHMF